MLDWLQPQTAGEHMAFGMMLGRLIAAALAGLIAAGIYKVSQRRSENPHSLMTTLVLLTVLVAMTTIVIGDSVARAFGLVGALSIVRFRTVVEDTRDTAFVIFAVVVGMALGAGNWAVCVVGMPIVAVAAVSLGRMSDWTSTATPEKKLEIRFGAGIQPEAALAEVFRGQLRDWRQVSVVSARQGAAFDLVYMVRLQNEQGLLALVKAIHALDGVQSVELRDA